MIDFKKYLSVSDAERLYKRLNSSNDIMDITENKLINKNTILCISLFLGLLGIDRFMLGNNKLGTVKCVTFISLIISIIGIGIKIMVMIADYFGWQSGFIFISMSEGIEIFGPGLYWSALILLILLGLYVIFWITDIILCRKSVLKRNFYEIMKNFD